MTQQLVIGPYKKTPKLRNTFGEDGKVEDVHHPLPLPAVGGPEDNWMKLGKTGHL